MNPGINKSRLAVRQDLASFVVGAADKATNLPCLEQIPPRLGASDNQRASRDPHRRCCLEILGGASVCCKLNHRSSSCEPTGKLRSPAAPSTLKALAWAIGVAIVSLSLGNIHAVGGGAPATTPPLSRKGN